MIQIRAAEKKDLQEIHRLSSECFGVSNAPIAQLEWLVEKQGDPPALFLFVADAPVMPRGSERLTTNEPVSDVGIEGSLSFKIHETADSKHVEVLEIAVGKLNRREGIGEALLQFALSWAKERGYWGVTFRTREGNTEMRALAGKLRFSIDRVVQKYYSDGASAVLFIQRLS